jgi:hypothetical protein
MPWPRVNRLRVNLFSTNPTQIAATLIRRSAAASMGRSEHHLASAVVRLPGRSRISTSPSPRRHRSPSPSLRRHRRRDHSPSSYRYRRQRWSPYHNDRGQDRDRARDRDFDPPARGGGGRGRGGAWAADDNDEELKGLPYFEYRRLKRQKLRDSKKRCIWNITPSPPRVEGDEEEYGYSDDEEKKESPKKNESLESSDEGSKDASESESGGC